MLPMSLGSLTPFQQGETQYSILRYAAMAAKWKEPPRDALDTLVLTTADLPSLDGVKQVSFCVAWNLGIWALMCAHRVFRLHF